MATMRIFLSHSHEDDAFCRAIVTALSTADVDVWYDEHNLGSGQLLEVIQRELKTRPVFLVILSPAAFHSTWVKDECRWVYHLFKRDATRIILPITASAFNASEFDDWLFLEDFMRIEAPQPQESADDFIERGKAMSAQRRWAEALSLFEQATQQVPQSFPAWFNKGKVLEIMDRRRDALVAYDQAIAIDPQNAHAWYNKGVLLYYLKRNEESLVVFDHVLTIEPMNAGAWREKSHLFQELGRITEADQAAARARALGRKREAQAAEARAKALRGG